MSYLICNDLFEFTMYKHNMAAPCSPVGGRTKIHSPSDPQHALSKMTKISKQCRTDNPV